MADEKLAILRAQIDHSVKWFRDARRRNRRNAFLLRFGTAALSAATTVVLGLQGFETYRVLLKNVALILSASVTVIAAWESFFNHRELWVRYTATLGLLRGLQSDLEYACAGNIQAEGLDVFHDRLNAILRETNASWLQLRDEANSTAATPKTRPGVQNGRSLQ